MSPSLERPAPAYMQIAEHFRMLIKNGELPEGAKLPSVVEISQGWQVASATAAKALGQLRSEGYVQSNNQGTFVSIAHKQTTGPDRLQMLRATGNGYRPGETAEVVSAELIEADSSVAQALSIDEGSSVIRRRRVYRDDLGVVTVSTSWLPGQFANAAPELLSTEPLPKMTFGLVEERTGRRAVRRRDVVALHPVPADVATTLGVDADTPSLTMTNLYWDQNGDPTEYAVDFLGTGRELSAEYSLG
ncbi:GntR family transcriptional regulator [Nocardia abscessus]|uniref:GntR family transcriptional regulator n=1 Tax=Nocardia abscessus TaxID=120957 RepID=UPI002453FA25|nr:GntR family transcriptional regulator [Nocardia abscessus]